MPQGEERGGFDTKITDLFGPRRVKNRTENTNRTLWEEKGSGRVMKGGVNSREKYNRREGFDRNHIVHKVRRTKNRGT